MPRRTPRNNLPELRRRGTPAARPRPRRPANYPYQNPYGQPYGYGGYHRSAGALHRAQAARALRRAHATAAFAYRVGRGAVVHRRRLAGLYAATAVLSTGAACSAMPSGVLVASLAGAAPAVYAGIKRRSARRRGEAAKLTAGQTAGWAARLALVAWLPLTAAFGFAPLLRLALASGCAIGLPWWAIHTRPAGELEPADEIERVGDEELDPISAQWLNTLGSRGGMFAGSYLIHPEVTEDGWEAILQLVPGRQRPESVLGAVVLIAGAYGVDPTRVSVRHMPDGRADQVRVAIHYANPLQEVREYPGPTLDRETGWVQVGVYPDDAPARWRLFEPGSGPCGGLIFGGQGSGKSSLANELAAEITRSGIGVLWIGDGQEGLSMSDWVDAGSRWYGYSLRETRRMLQAAERVLHSRQRRRKRMTWVDDNGRTRKRKGSFDAMPGEPFLFVLVDEWPEVGKDPECRRIVSLLLRTGRKVGITCIVTSQIPSVAQFGGDDDASVIRSLSSTTNVAMFRIPPADKASQHMGGMGVDGVDPSSIPAAFADGAATSGMGYLRAPGGTVGVFRSHKVSDPLDWSQTAPALDLEPEAIEAAGEHYQDWRERCALVDDGEDDPADLAEAEEREQQRRGDQVASLPRTALPPADAGAQVVAMPQNTQLGPREGALRILRGTGQILSTAQLAHHYNALTGTDTAVNAMTSALRRAADDGEVVQLPALPTGKDRSARWQAASEIPEADRERDA